MTVREEVRSTRYAAMDELLGSVFSAARVIWAVHIDTVTDFWSWQLLGGRATPAIRFARTNRSTPGCPSLTHTTSAGSISS